MIYKIRIHGVLAIISLCVVMMMASCRDDSDELASYAYSDVLNFGEANSSLEGQFKAIWTAMNCNYPIWDYEEDNGVDWDNVYETYISKFRKLDEEYGFHNPVPDSIVFALYDSIFNSLHDGHMSLYLANVYTRKKISHVVAPQIHRAIENVTDNLFESVYLAYFKPTLDYYVDNADVKFYRKEDDYIYGLFKDDISYLRLPQFDLTPTFNERSSDESKEKICQLWELWFNDIQALHENGCLKGIIIDLRNNTGGYANDYQYVLGALTAGDEVYHGMYHKIGYLREKSGVGRLDFSFLQPFKMRMYDEEHANITVPIVILANNLSASTSEIICIAAKQMVNGYVIGTKTFGAFSPSADASYAITYAGNVGDPALSEKEEKSQYFASFFVNIPTSAFLSIDKKVMDGNGIVPDESVQFDWLEHSISYKDNQLDRALEYIRTKN